MSRLFDAAVVDNISISSIFKIISLRPLSEMSIPKAGQFFMLQTGKTYDPLLKRPFSLFRYQNGILQFLYRIRGKGTVCVADMQSGETVQMLGPLGNAYPIPTGDFIAVSGGIGIASIFPLLEKCPDKAYLFYGARNSDELLMLDEAKALAKEAYITTDDGSAYKKGLITGQLIDHVKSAVFTKNPLSIYACGSTPMLKEIARILNGSGLTCSASLEEVMACGVGACLGCVVKTISGYKRVCKEGPVFNIKDILWE